jgi:hypothetical protein
MVAGTPCAMTSVCDGAGSCGNVSCPSGCIGAFGGCQLGESAFDCGSGGGACADCTLGGFNCSCNVNVRACLDLEQQQACGPKN